MGFINHVCTSCGSDRMAYLCSCGEMRCSCESDCENCAQIADDEEQQGRYEEEQRDREDFESEMDYKYR